MTEHDEYTTEVSPHRTDVLNYEHFDCCGQGIVPRVERWQSMAGLGFSSYEASTAGEIRSVDRTVSGRRLKGKTLSTRVSNRGYVLVNLTDDNGKQVTRTVHTLILGAFDGLCPPGMQARHLNDDPLNNQWAPGGDRDARMAAGGNLMYGTPADNNGDKVRNGNRAPAAVRVPKLCVRCQGPFMGNGRRCHACVVWIGQTAGQMLARGVSLSEAMDQLEYPSAEGLHTLAVRYGDYGLQRSGSDGSWLRRVIATVRDWMDVGDGA